MAAIVAQPEPRKGRSLWRNKLLNSLTENNFWDEAISWILAGIALFLPLIFSPFNYDSYTLPKVVFLRLMLFLALLLLVLKIIFNGEFETKKSPLNLPVILFLTTASLATLFSISKTLSFFGQYKRYEDIFTLLSYGFLYFLALNHLNNDKRRNRFLFGLLLSATIVATYAILQFFGIDFLRTTADSSRSISTFGNAVFLGTFLALIFPIALGKALSASSWQKRIFFAFTFLIFTALITTFSRGSWFGFIFSLLFMLFLLKKDILHNNKKWLLSLALLAIIFFSLVSLLAIGKTERISPFSRAVSIFNPQTGSIRNRLLFWQATLVMITKRPLFGYGPDTLALVFPNYLSWEAKNREPGAKIDKAHNDFLQIAATLGLLGLASYFFILLVFFGSGWQRVKEAENTNEATFLLSLLAASLAYFLASQFSFSEVEVTSFFWLTLGLFFSGKYDSHASQESAPKREKFFRQSLSLSLLIGLGFLAFLWFKTTFYPLVADIHFQKGVQDEARGELSQATSHLEKAAALGKHRSLYHTRLGRNYQLNAEIVKKEKKILLKKALLAYAQAEQLDPFDPIFYINLGSLYTRLGLSNDSFNEMAIKAYKRSIYLNPRAPEAHVDLAVTYMQKGLPHLAIKELKEVLRWDPQNVTAHINLGLIYQKQGRKQEASFHLNKALQLDKNSKIETVK